MTIQRSVNTPLWRQIAQILQGEIDGGTLPAGSRLPTEAELAKRFEVNRHTVRQGLAYLESRSVIRTEQGRGSFVNEPVIDYTIGTRTRFTENIAQNMSNANARLIECKVERAEIGIANALEVPVGERTLVLTLLRVVDGRPLSLADHHFPHARFPGLEDAYRRHQTVTGALTACGCSDYERRETRIGARMPKPLEANLLECNRHKPLLITESINVDTSGQTIEFGVAAFVSDRIQLVVDQSAEPLRDAS
ncbi:MAG: phosphonate metabolism transcriptional regulator PhnF [Pseudomonadota bacterium]